jgi:type II secretory pathway component GspD/PulD (secretin)
MKRAAFVVLLVTFVTTALAQGLEVISLHHRSAEQLLPQLQPLLEPGATLTGSGDKLFLRASSRNQAEIRKVLEVLDRPLRRLMITVRQGGSAEGQRAGISGSVVLTPGDSSVRARAGERHYATRDSISQQVQTVEGGRAYINVGREIALPFREVVLTPAGAVVSRGMTWYDVGTGFEAEPRLAGDNVTIDISPRHDTLGPVPGSANVRRLSTTVSGRLGEWISLGGTRRESAGDSGGTVHYGTRSGREQGEIWLKVEELP